MDISSVSDIICAPATSVGSGAVSIVRVSGDGCLALVDKVVSFVHGSAAASDGYVLKYGRIEGVDEVIVSIFRAPHSYTGEESAEISCHASSYIVGRILDLLCAAGCRMAEPGEFTRRAFVNGKMDLAQAEAVADLIASSTQAQHRVALSQLRGGYSAELGRLRADLLELATLLELELDFSEEEVEFADRYRLGSLLDSALGRCEELAESFRTGNAIRNGVPVAIVGAPNSGKSTLLNALLHDDRAIVSDIPGTTRDTLEECCVIDGVMFRFIDTAGLRETEDVVERMGIERAASKASTAEIVVGVVDLTAGSAVGSPDVRVEALGSQIDSIVSLLGASSSKLVLLFNKVDGCQEVSSSRCGVSDEFAGSQGFVNGEIEDEKAVNKNVIVHNISVLLFKYQQYKPKVIFGSAKHGIGLEELRQSLVSAVGTLPDDGILVTNARHARALRHAADSLSAARAGLTSLPSDLLAEELREAIRSLGSITGQVEIGCEELLGSVFSRFCIGK